MAGHRWARVDTQYLRNPKLSRVSAEGVLLHLSSILHCAAEVTDGQIGYRSLSSIGSDARIHPKWIRRRATELEEAGLWLPEPGGWRLHDFQAMNPQAMREMVERERAQNRARQAAWKARQAEEVTP